MSFIIPALNAASTIATCLDAILAATRGDLTQVLLIDNGSTDRTVELARGRGAVIISAPTLTVAAMRNLGARLAEGEILAYVDADCVIAGDWLEQGLPHFSDPTVGAVGSPTHPPSNATWVQRTWTLHRHRHNRPGPVEWLPTENLLVRKTAFHEVHGFNPRLITCEDVDFCYRLGVRYRIVNDPRLRSIHLGEAPTLSHFFRKEAWRGTGNIAGVLSHRWRLSELPSVLLPVYHAIGSLALVGALGYWLANGTWWPALAVGLMLLAPSLLLALSTASLVGQRHRWPAFLLLYITYTTARSLALSRGPWTTRKNSSTSPTEHVPLTPS